MLLEFKTTYLLGEGVVAGRRQAEAQLLLRQEALVPDVELLERLPQRVLECHGTLSKNPVIRGRPFMTSLVEWEGQGGRPKGRLLRYVTPPTNVSHLCVSPPPVIRPVHAI